jgi:ABC-type transporter Mla MlaB component
MARPSRGAGHIVLKGSVTLQAVEAIHAQFLALDDRPAITIDCSAATEVDVSLVQLILAARASAQRAGRSVTLAKPAAGALLDTLRRGGFLSAMHDNVRDHHDFWLGSRS